MLFAVSLACPELGGVVQTLHSLQVSGAKVFWGTAIV